MPQQINLNLAEVDVSQPGPTIPPQREQQLIALMRVRPKAMTVAVILAGLLPILIGTGSEAMSRTAAPMAGGMLTAPLLSLFVLPAIYALRRVKNMHAN